MQATTYKFGEFEAHPARFELLRDGQKVRIERIPLELLILLLENQGRLVSRQEIVDRLWGKDVYLDTEHGINTAIRKIRAALQDDRDAPRFLHTVAGKGYRFVAISPDPAEKIEAAQEAIPPIEPATVPEGTQKRSPVRWWAIGSACFVVLLMASLFVFRAALFGHSDVGPIHSVAVLPLTNLSGDAKQDYFADGMTDEVITMLAKQTTLRVVSRTSAMQFKGAKRPMHDIAHDLGVDGVMEGSISRVNGRVHLTMQLIYGPTDTHVWADSYDRDFEHAFELPAEISDAVGKKLNTETRVAKQKQVNSEAHDAYLQARYQWFTGSNKQAEELYERAITLQPDYAAAWAGLANTFTAAAATEQRRSREVADRAQAAARKALELDDSLAEAHHALAAYYFFFAWDLPGADAESRRAIELDPNVAEQHHLHSYILFAMNRIEEAIAEQKHAMDIAPFERPWGLGWAYLQARQFDAAIAELRMRLEAKPDDSGGHRILSYAYWNKGMYDDAERELETAFRAQSPAQAEAAHNAYLAGGRHGVARWSIEELMRRSRTEFVAARLLAEQYALLGDREKTLQYLEESLRDRDARMMLVQTEPVYDFVHNEPRYQAVVRQAGLQLLPDKESH